MDPLTSLTVFGRVVECGGFSAAARRLNMSVTMVSNHVQALEDRLGVRLLNRVGLEHEADSITRNIIACTGRQFCNIAVSETKGHAFGLMDAMRAKGFSPRFRASSAVISTRAAAPSLRPDALAAVTVPSLVKAGLRPEMLSSVVPGRMNSS